MTQDPSRKYYAHRAEKAREMGHSAANRKVAAIHFQLAALYDELVASEDDRPQLRIGRN